MRSNVILCAFVVITSSVIPARAGLIEYGNENLLNTGSYPSDPKAGATLSGLAPGVVTMATNSFGHGYPFSPSPGDYPGTDQIYVGSVQTASHDGYSEYAGRVNGPQVITMNYSSLLPVGQSVATLTLGIASDDFQNPVFGQPFTATINGVTDVALTNTLNGLNDAGPTEQFFTIGISTSALLSNNILTLTIDEGGDGGDGWAIDFLTIGVTTSAVPEPSTVLLLGSGLFAVAFAGIRGIGRKLAPR
jgi:PEP-CTERM motif